MRILLVSYFFPPYNSSGALRVGKTAKHLIRRGHDVRVISARDQPLPPSLPLEIEPERVLFTRWLNVNSPVELLLGGRKRVAHQGFSVTPGSFGRLARAAGRTYKALVNFPDGQIGWFPFACSAAARLLKNWQPDILLASAWPITALYVGRSLSRRHRIPWVAELRDLWTQNPYHHPPAWRLIRERRMEHRLLASAAGLVTVSSPMAETLKSEYHRPVEVVANGVDLEDHVEPSHTVRAPDASLTLIYTGMLYEGRDLSPLFSALRILQTRSVGVRLRFYGRYLEAVAARAKQHGVEEFVDVHPMVSRSEALRLQHEADVLLLLLLNNVSEKGTYTGKLFDYLGAQRPILLIGGKDSVAATLIRACEIGWVVETADEIVALLERLAAEKRRSGFLPPIPDPIRERYAREKQVAILEAFLHRCLAQSSMTETPKGTP